MVRKLKPKLTRTEKLAQKELQTKMNMFDRLPNECSACLQDFDKTDREMVTTWNVVVRQADKIVRLYCPSCWDLALDVIKKHSQDDNRI